MAANRIVIVPTADAGPQLIGPISAARFLWRHRQLTLHLARRQFDARFRGSALGWLLALVNPLLLLTVYTIVFTRFLGVGGDDPIGFAFRLFSALVFFGVFTDAVGRAPTLVAANPNFVKKVVFPLEVLPIVEVLAAAMAAVGSLAVLLVALGVTGRLSWWAAAVPIVLPALVSSTVGIAWIVAAIGVYVRDLASSIGVLLTVVLYLTPVFYELDALGDWRIVAQANPLAAVVDSGRRMLVRGGPPDWAGLGWSTAAGFLVAWAGFVWFRVAKRGFADVV